ncbi:MAG: protein-glutamine glutaminase family protein [Candidatus Bathyarchaeia archaeon]
MSSYLFTVAAIRRSPDGKTSEVLFNESPRIFRLGPKTKDDEVAVGTIQKVLARKIPIEIGIDQRRNLITRVTEPSKSATRRFLEARVTLEKPEKPRVLHLEKVDHNTFSIVDYYLKVPVFKICKKIVPNYLKAKEIFDYSAKQSCALPGPYDIDPCIPFQYVIDGCYARAHKMRWIISKHFGYCCEKVFSFANEDNDRLAVLASKWGGCCVTWWFHVAPLIRVKVKFGKCSFVKAMVIDPGMFDQPVALSTWLSAQANATCSSNANVSMYSIQPGSAYLPANYEGTQFTTDDSYTATDAALRAYQNLQTCS